MQAVSLDPNNPEQSLAANQKRPTLTNVNPTFLNPTGACWSKEQRLRFAEIADHTGVTVFEDDPYRELKYGNVDRTPVCAGFKRSFWIYQGSFSKNLAPELRLGFLTASPDLWLRLNAVMNTSALLSDALLQKVAFMPGEPFFLDTSRGYSALQLNFSHGVTDDVDNGLSLLSYLIRRHG